MPACPLERAHHSAASVASWHRGSVAARAAAAAGAAGGGEEQLYKRQQETDLAAALSRSSHRSHLPSARTGSAVAGTCKATHARTISNREESARYGHTEREVGTERHPANALASPAQPG